ncbi:MAG TPA: hypothetical protein VF717_18210 [Pyrinomonadaceae bacterium]|jgi:hypothetical protein
MIDIYSLEEGTTYVVRRGFRDFYGNVFTPGELLTYVERHFLPYDGGHTIVFKERSIYLQEEVNTEIIDSFADYLARPEHQ